MRNRSWDVYILSNYKRSVLYTGITNDLYRRIFEHREGKIKGFTQQYKVTFLMHYESFQDPMEAILREKEIKGWVRRKKEALINSTNPEWTDLSKDWPI